MYICDNDSLAFLSAFCLLLKADPTVRGAHSSSAVNQLYQPYTGVGVGDPATQTAVASMGARYPSTAAYTGPTSTQQTGVGAGRVRSSEEMSYGYQQRGYPPPAGNIGSGYQSRNMAMSSSRPAAVESATQRLAAQQMWNNQPSLPVSSPFITHTD